MTSILCICDQGYRASIEEQDDTVVWMAHMLQRDDAMQVALMLRGTAVNYANKAQRSVGVSFGKWVQAHPADFPRDLERFISDGGRVFAMYEDLAKRGLSADDLIPGVVPVERGNVAGLVAEYDNVSFW